MQFSPVRELDHGQKSEIEFSLVLSSGLHTSREYTGPVAVAQARGGQFNLLLRFETSVVNGRSQHL